MCNGGHSLCDGRQRWALVIVVSDRCWRRSSYTERRSLATLLLRLPWIFMYHHVAHFLVIVWSSQSAPIKIFTRWKQKHWLIATGYVIINEWKKTKKRCQWWVKEWLLRRSNLVVNYTILPELRTDFPEYYKKYLCLYLESFDYIVKVVSPIISKQELQDTHQMNYCCIKKNSDQHLPKSVLWPVLILQAAIC